MFVDITDIVTEIQVDIEFKTVSSVINEFGIPVITNVVKKIKCAFVEKDFMDTSRKNGDPFMLNVASVWIAAKDVISVEDFIGAHFKFSDEFYEITGAKKREQISSHIEFLAKKRIDIR